MIWICRNCSIEGLAESFPTRHVPAVTSFVEGRTLSSTRMACPLCGGALKPKTRAEIEADEDRRFVAAIEHEIASRDASEVPARDNSSDGVAAALIAAAASSPAQPEMTP